jgi:hypothetical protein
LYIASALAEGRVFEVRFDGVDISLCGVFSKAKKKSRPTGDTTGGTVPSF